MSTIKILPLTAGPSTGQLYDDLQSYWANAWDQSPNASIALLTIKANVQGKDANNLTITIVPQYYAINATPSTIFCIGSVTKVFTGTLLAARINDPNMVDAGYSLTANVNKFLPAPADISTGRISATTLGQLATHSSCMKDRVPHMDYGLYGTGGPPSHKEVKQWCHDANWMDGCVAGNNSIYSNWGSRTLGFAIAQGATYVYDAVLSDYITCPTMFNMPNTNTQTTTQTVQGYTPKGKPARNEASGIRSSVQDMATFISTYLDAACRAAFHLSSTEQQVFIQQMVSTVTKQVMPNISMGIDWYYSPLINHTLLYSKNGMTGKQGFSAWAGFSTNFTPPQLQPVAGVGAVVLVNKAMKGSARAAKPEYLGKQAINFLYGLGNAGEPEVGPDVDDDIDEEVED